MLLEVVPGAGEARICYYWGVLCGVGGGCVVLVENVPGVGEGCIWCWWRVCLVLLEGMPGTSLHSLNQIRSAIKE